MALPLIVLGAGIAAAYASNQISKHNDRKNGIVGAFPGESKFTVEPQTGGIVCCDVYEMFEHSGIWVDGNVIELQGTGLIRGISPSRFTHDRSGNTIYVACDSNNMPLTDNTLMQRAVSKLYEYRDYHVVKNNCNRFVAECLSGTDKSITTFTELNHFLSEYFGQPIYWLPAAV